MRALVTGATGFVGPYLIKELLACDYHVTALARTRSHIDNLEQLGVSIEYGDVTDLTSICKAVQQAQPDIVFHLAAQSFVPASWSEPYATMHTNLTGTINVLEAVKRHAVDAVVHVCGSSEEYGLVTPEETPITENNPLRPLSPYGVSKVAADLAGWQYARSFGIKVLRTRAFNHTGVGRGPQFVTATIARQAVEIHLGKRDAFFLGNTDAARDFTDVRDVVRAYRMLAEGLYLGEQENGEVYNICSGEAISIGLVVDIAASLTNVPVNVCRDPAKMRPSDVPVLLGDCRKLRDVTGWEPAFTFTDTMAGMLAAELEAQRGRQ